jgi:3-dehydroquinate dehydratase-2
MKRYRILVLNGPNLNLLGVRETRHYGRLTLDQIARRLERFRPAVEKAFGCRLALEWKPVCNSEEKMLAAIHACVDARTGRPRAEGILINPAAFTHTSVAVRDALAAVAELGVPAVEVHLSNTAAREDFRRHSLTAPVCLGSVAGFRAAGYLMALYGLADHLTARDAPAKAAGNRAS